MTLTQVRKYALSLAEVTEAPHFDRTSFRIRRRIFLTARPADSHIHVFVPEESREPALATYSQHVEKLLWGGKVVGLRVQLSGPAVLVKGLIHAAWACKAPKSLVAPKQARQRSNRRAS
jgi:hypothetical protein